MRKHPTHVEGFDGSVEQLAKLVCRMRYDKVEVFFEACAEELNRQACVDAKAKRMKLAERLQKAALHQLSVLAEIRLAFNICIPFMRKELQADSEFMAGK